MVASNRRPRKLGAALTLLILLGVTTGWSQPTAAGRLVEPVSRPGASLATSKAIAARLQAADQFAARLQAAGQFAVLSALAGHPAAVAAAGLFASVQIHVQAGVEVATAKADKPTTRVKPPAAPVYSGRNHFWIPSLGMSYSVHAYACGSQRYPDNLIYRWGCAGRNNVYLFGHAYGVMKRLHDLYVRGGLHVGMLAIYADGSGRIRSYRVTTWRVVTPGDSEWAIADQRVPSMTLQTCVGADYKLRLNVRLVAVN